MKIEIAVKELSTVLKQALGVVQGKVTIPVLSYVKLEVVGVKAFLSGSDLGMSIIQTFDIKATASGNCEVLLPGKRLQDFLSALTGEARIITIEQEQNVIILKSGKFRAKLPYIPTDQFPAIEVRPEVKCKLPLGKLKLLVRRVECAVPTKEGRYSIPVISIEALGSKLSACATDGARIALATEPNTTGADFDLLIPKIALPVIREMTGEEAEFCESETNYFFKTQKEQLLVRKSPAKFPDYKKIVATADFKTKITVGSKELSESITSVQPVVDGKNPAIWLEAEGSEVMLSSQSIDGEAHDSLAVLLTGIPNRARLNPGFILDFLAQADGQPINIELVNGSKLVRFSKDDTYHYFIMPMMDEPAAEGKAKKEK